MRRPVPVCLLIAATAAFAGPAEAQSARHLVTGEISAVRIQSTAPLVADQLSGVLVGGRALVSFWRFEFEARYGQGRLTPAGGAALARDLVEGHAMLGVRPLRWVALRVGPHLRAYVEGGVTERWLLWEGRARIEVPVASPYIMGHFETWRALSGNITNGLAPFANSQGAEAGMTVRLPRSPVYLRLGYGIERARVDLSNSLDAIETLRAEVGLGAR